MHLIGARAAVDRDDRHARDRKAARAMSACHAWHALIFPVVLVLIEVAP